MSALILFAATFTCVFTLGLQQLNVTAGRHGLAFGTGLAIGASQLVLYKVLPGPTSALEIAAFLFGGACGVVVSMEAHPQLLRLVEHWPSLAGRARQWLCPDEPQADVWSPEQIDRVHELARLASEIALAAAHAEVVTEGVKVKLGNATERRNVEWIDTHVNAIDQASLDRAARYLELRGVLVRHPMQPALVRFQC